MNGKGKFHFAPPKYRPTPPVTMKPPVTEEDLLKNQIAALEEALGDMERRTEERKTQKKRGRRIGLGSFLHRVMREVSEHAAGPRTPLKLGCAWDDDIKTSALTLVDGGSVTLTVSIDEDLLVCRSDESVARATLKLWNNYGKREE